MLKEVLDNIKTSISKISKEISFLILVQTVLGFIIGILFFIIVEVVFAGAPAVFLTYNIVDTYSFIDGLSATSGYISILGKVLGPITIIFSLLFFAASILVIFSIFKLSIEFKKIGDTEKTLVQAPSIRLWLLLYCTLTSLAFFLPFFGWIIALILANAGINVAFYKFQVILSKYGFKPQVVRNTAYLILSGSFIKIIFGILMFVHIYFFIGIILGNIFYSFAFWNLKNHIRFIAPVMRDAPPPPSIPAPSSPPPRPVIGANGKIEVAKVPSPPASEFDEET
ncbi:MAG: hypothetical protein HeimAB125_19670 [Candidatus Heimdallarchaeota archaeon AB_125]|nr:MAG: hypothetical protein HeimAB125_19670 [Candidatus Heimdallarchaeota archaeon AB_125]